jgi:hypothetical protein
MSALAESSSRRRARSRQESASASPSCWSTWTPTARWPSRARAKWSASSHRTPPSASLFGSVSMRLGLTQGALGSCVTGKEVAAFTGRTRHAHRRRVPAETTTDEGNKAMESTRKAVSLDLTPSVASVILKARRCSIAGAPKGVRPSHQSAQGKAVEDVDKWTAVRYSKLSKSNREKSNEKGNEEHSRICERRARN